MTSNLLIFIRAHSFAFFGCLQIWMVSACMLGGCHHFSGNAISGDVPSPANVQKIALIDSGSTYFDSLRNGAVVHRFYYQHHFVPVWWEHKKPSVKADSMLRFIRSVREYGLLPDQYHAAELNTLLYDSAYEDEQTIRRTDMLLTDAFLSIFKDLRYGRLASGLFEADSLREIADSVAVTYLKNCIAKDDVRTTFEGQEPVHAQYALLKEELRRILQNDSTVSEALRAGAVPDSSIAGLRIASLEINMDRWRMETAIGKRHILVNIPGCYLEVVEHDTVSFDSRVIVGTSKSQTPLLDGLIRSFIIYPYWNVPRSISVKEILPQVRKDISYLANHHYEVINTAGEVVIPDSIDWSVLNKSNFPYTLRQKEGIHNALGLIKFWFNNPYAVFLHDTNARLLFDRKKRALSHGCVRVEKAMELGRYLVKGNDIVTPEDLDQYLEFEKQMAIRVTEPIPVHFRYFTCAWRKGTVEYYDDIYGEDKIAFDQIYPKAVVQEEMLLAQNGGN